MIAPSARASGAAAKSIGVEYLEGSRQLLLTVGYRKDEPGYPISLRSVPLGRINELDEAGRAALALPGPAARQEPAVAVPQGPAWAWVQVDVPIQLASFNAVPDGQRVKLNWITANELNNDYFTVEKSLDGRTFVFIEKVEGAGTSSRILNYSTIDYSPWSGASYYRLKQTDFDGNATYSKIISVDLGQTGALSFNLYPNPSPGGELTLKFKNATIGTLQAKIVDLVGKEVFVQGVTVANNGDFTTTMLLLHQASCAFSQALRTPQPYQYLREDYSHRQQLLFGMQ